MVARMIRVTGKPVQRLRAMVGLAILLGGCAAEAPVVLPEVNDVENAQYGAVQRTDSRFAKNLEDCARPAYAAGIDVGGRKLTDRGAVMAAYSAWLKTAYTYDGEDKPATEPTPAKTASLKPARSQPRASSGGPVASSTNGVVRSGDAAQDGEPAFARAYFTAEKATWDCVHAKGWNEIRR